MTTLTSARKAAEEVVAMLRPGCARIEIAGSVRRERPDVGDLEIVCIPQRGGKPVWGEPASAAGPLEALVARLVQTRQLAFDPALKRNGAKYKRLLYHAGALRLPVDLFIADPSGDNFGNLLTIRTGDADFSRMLVTPRTKGGLMPDGMWQKDGYLWEVSTSTEEECRRIDCPEEADFFGALGLFVPSATDRSLDTVAMLQRARVMA